MRSVENALDLGGGLVRVCDHPALRSSLYRAVAAGVLQVVLPGVLARAGEVDRVTWLRAVCLWCPGGVLHGETALALWLQRPETVTRLALPSDRACDRRISPIRRVIPAEFVVSADGLRLVNAAYASVEHAPQDEGRSIMDALRQRLVLPGELLPALTALAGTAGQAARVRLVHAAVRNPWSYAESLLQKVMLGARIGGWVANQPLRIGGRLYFPDIRFEDVPLIIEFDGYEDHSSHAQFVADRERQNAFVVAGYRVLRFTWEQLTERPDYVVATIRAVLQALRSQR